MLRTPTYVRALLVAGATLVMAAISAAPASAQPVSEQFHADLQDQCAVAKTEGTLTWPDPFSTSLGPSVGVRGIISGANLCADEQTNRRIFAVFTAFVGNQSVDYQQEYLNPNNVGPQLTESSRAFRFQLVNSDGRDQITRVEIRVCRDFGPWLPAFQCGATQVYWGPSIIPPPQPPEPPIEVPAAA